DYSSCLGFTVGSRGRFARGKSLRGPPHLAHRVESMWRSIDQSIPPIKEFGQEQHRQPCTVVESERLDLAFLVERELLPHEQNLTRQGGLAEDDEGHEGRRFAQEILT